MKRFLIPCMAMGMLWLTSCVNEWPHPESRLYDVTLLVHCDTEWLPDYSMTYTRVDGMEIGYQFQLYKSGTTTDPVWENTIYSNDFTRKDFTLDLALYPGEYDLYVWSDVCDASTGKSLYYDTRDFATITYLEPYEGDTDLKDAFRGMHSFKIDNTIYLEPTATEKVTLERPLAKYMFVATDLSDFIDKELTRGRMRGLDTRQGETHPLTRELEEELSTYYVKIIYPLYVPAVFDNFTDKPIDSWTGISFDARITPRSEDEAILGFDYVMVNNSESGVQVAMEIYDEEGTKIGSTATILISTLRDRTTIVYGRFLTSQEDAGVSIDPNFSGQFNIQYK